MTSKLPPKKAQKLCYSIWHKMITKKKLHKFLGDTGFWRIWVLDFTKTMMLTQTISLHEHPVIYLCKYLDLITKDYLLSLPPC